MPILCYLPILLLFFFPLLQRAADDAVKMKLNFANKPVNLAAMSSEFWRAYSDTLNTLVFFNCKVGSVPIDVCIMDGAVRACVCARACVY